MGTRPHSTTSNNEQPTAHTANELRALCTAANRTRTSWGPDGETNLNSMKDEIIKFGGN